MIGLSEKNNNAQLVKIIRMIALGCGIVHLLLVGIAAVNATPLLGVDILEDLGIVAQIAAVIVSVLLILVAYVLNATAHGGLASICALIALVLNLSRGIDFSNATNLVRFLVDAGLPFLVISYSVSNGKERNSVVWLIFAMLLCYFRVALTVLEASAETGAAMSIITGILWICTHLCMFVSFIPDPVKQIVSSSWKPAYTLTCCVGIAVFALAGLVVMFINTVLTGLMLAVGGALFWWIAFMMSKKYSVL